MDKNWDVWLNLGKPTLQFIFVTNPFLGFSPLKSLLGKKSCSRIAMQTRGIYLFSSFRSKSVFTGEWLVMFQYSNSSTPQPLKCCLRKQLFFIKKKICMTPFYMVFVTKFPGENSYCIGKYSIIENCYVGRQKYFNKWKLKIIKTTKKEKLEGFQVSL